MIRIWEQCASSPFIRSKSYIMWCKAPSQDTWLLSSMVLYCSRVLQSRNSLKVKKWLHDNPLPCSAIRNVSTANIYNFMLFSPSADLHSHISGLFLYPSVKDFHFTVVHINHSLAFPHPQFIAVFLFNPSGGVRVKERTWPGNKATSVKGVKPSFSTLGKIYSSMFSKNMWFSGCAVTARSISSDRSIKLTFVILFFSFFLEYCCAVICYSVHR